MPQEAWWEICERLYDDSAGAIDPPEVLVDATDRNTVQIHFATAVEETFWRLAWLE